jgi:SAM-dependent methyltransferase
MDAIYSEQYWELFASLDTPLPASNPDLLHAIAGQYLTNGARILDAGCRDAAHLIRLVKAHDGSGVGVDPVDWHVERAAAAVASAGLAGQIQIVQGVMETLDFPDGHFDFVWCRDVLEVVGQLEPAVRESARVLKTNGFMLVYTNFATERLDAQEMEMLRALGNSPRSMIEANVEGAFREAGLIIAHKEAIGTSWREYDEERTQPISRDMLRLARLRRQRDVIIAEYGEQVYRTAEASLHWLVFQILGKLAPTLYILQRRAEGHLRD